MSEIDHDAAIVAEEINHDVVKRAAQNLIAHAEKFSMAELHKADMAGVVGLSLAYLDLAVQLQAERQRVKNLEELVQSCAELNKYARPKVSQGIIEVLTSIMEGRDNG